MSSTHILGVDEVYNHDFGVAAETGAAFPDGWFAAGGDALTAFEWTTENSLAGGRTVKIVNPSFTAGPVLVVQEPAFALPCSPGDVWFGELTAMTDVAGKQLRLLLFFLDGAKNFLVERHLKFASAATMGTSSGHVRVPQGAAFVQVVAGMHDTGTLWIDEVSLKRMHPVKAQPVSQSLPTLDTFVAFRETTVAVNNLPIFTPPEGHTVYVHSIHVSAPGTVAVTVRFGTDRTIYKGFFDPDNRHSFVTFPVAVSAGVAGLAVTLTTSANVQVAVTVAGYHPKRAPILPAAMSSRLSIWLPQRVGRSEFILKAPS